MSSGNNAYESPDFNKPPGWEDGNPKSVNFKPWFMLQREEQDPDDCEQVICEQGRTIS